MEEVRLEDYEGRERRTTRFFHDEQERSEMPLLAKAGIGIAVTAGVLSAAHRTGAMRKIAQFLDNEAKASVQAAREVWDTQGNLFRGTDKLTPKRMKAMKDSFMKKRGEIKQNLAYAPKDILNSRKFRMAEELNKRRHFLGEMKSQTEYTSGIPYTTVEGFRHTAIFDDIRKNSGMSRSAVDELEKAVNRGYEGRRLGILDYGTDEQLKLMLKKHGKGIDTSKALDVLTKAREKYRGKDFVPNHPEVMKVVEGMTKKFEDATALHMQNATRKNNKFKSFVIGHEQATVQDILDMHKAGKIQINKDLEAEINDVMKRNKSFAEAVFDEDLYLVKRNGEINGLMDYKVFKDMKRSQADWWANTIPGGLMRLRDILEVKRAREEASIRIFQRGTTLSALNAHRGFEATEALNEEVVFMYGKFVKLHDPDALNDSKTALKILNENRDMYLTTSQFGTLPKMHRHISGLMTDNDKKRNLFSELADVGNQDKDSVFNQFFSIFTKFGSKEWERNRVKNAIRNGFESPEDMFEMNTYFKLNTQGFSPRVLNNMKDLLPRSVNDFPLQEFIRKDGFSFSRDEDMLELFKKIGETESKRKGATQHSTLVSLFKQFERDPNRVLDRRTPIGESNPIIGHHTRIQTGMDEIKQQTSLYLVNEMLLKRPGAFQNMSYQQLANSFRHELKGMHADGKIWREDLEQAESLLNYSIFNSMAFNMRNNTDAAVTNTGNLFRLDKDFQEAMRTMARKTNPMWERHSSIKPVNQVNDDYIAINEANLGGVFNKIFGMDSKMTDRVDGLKDLGKQLSPRTGRDNLEDVTTATLFGNYFPMYRLQDALGNAGLGFSDASMGNAYQMFNALMFKRFLPLVGGVEAVKYADYKMDQWTGEGLDERWENYKANARLGDALSRTQYDIYQARRERMLHPGIEHWADMPGVHIPGLGPISAGDILNNTLGPVLMGGKVTLREDDLMTYDETLDDLYYGEEEVRKSRWWLMGSKSAYRGGRITEFAPNSFRKAHSDWEYSGTGATGEEYWGNHLLPTLENPLGGLSFALGLKDPYWYERKHYYDRPYMLTGELFNPNTMAFGDIGNATIGRLIKPVEEMHPEYWGDPILIYEDETSQLGQRPDGPVRTEVSPAGRVTHEVYASPEEYGATYTGGTMQLSDEAQADFEYQKEAFKNDNSLAYYISHEHDAEGNLTGAMFVQDAQTNESIYVPANVAKEDIPKEKLFQMARTDAPQGTYVKAVASASEAPSYQAQVSTQPRAMFDEDFAYRQDIQYRKMMNIQDPRTGEWRLQEGMENWTEPLGVYKWIMGDEVLGHDPYTGSTVIQRADAATNLSNRFWDAELGSLGGQISEIGRRFLRRDDGKLDQYNPIRNTMPEWLPGDDYFINFQIGDPYSKLPNGEYRLPGAAYESLNELHPDETGRYGAFDKFKILADVAPFSDEYNFWSQYLLDTLPEGSDMRKEATQIRKQVSARRTKYEFTPYRFKGNDIVTEEVTVKKFLDDYTFLTEELGDTPVRLAGMQYRKKAEGVLQQYFQVGDKVKIGVAEEEDKRISQDTYGTMRAVIFNELGNINKMIIEKGEMVEAQNDFSAAGVHARFTPQEIRKGAKWEGWAHMSSPLNTKFLQVRTALEEYERDHVYGKDWATWENFMMSDYVIPTLQGLGRFDNPLWSGVAGGTTGLVLGRFFLQGGKTTKIAAYAGALFGLGSNMFFKRYEQKHGEAWIPEARRTENELNEYFDILKYLKYEGLYQAAREEIAHQTGYDVEDFAQLIEENKALTKERKGELEAEKKQLFIDQPEGWEERRSAINAELEKISQDKGELYLPESFLQALSYKEERDTTLYAIDPYGDRMELMKAFPYKDKWFVQDFINATDEEKEKILKLVPENQRRIYKALWGMGLEDQKPLEYYMQKYDIPDWNWEGWRPEYSLEDIKVKAVQEAGLDMSSFNFWDDDIAASQYVPDLQEGDGGGNEFYQERPPSNFKGFNALKQNLINILQGQGLRNVNVVVTPNVGSESQVNFTYTEDRQDEIEEHLRQYGSRYV